MENFCYDIVSCYTPDEFRIHFRMSKVTVEMVYQHVSSALALEPDAILCDSIQDSGKQYVRSLISISCICMQHNF